MSMPRPVPDRAMPLLTNAPVLRIVEKPRARWDYKRGMWREVNTYHNRLAHYWLKRCSECGAEMCCGINRSRCSDCLNSFDLGAKRAHAVVSAAVKCGLLPRACEQNCVDCGRTAQVYEHRDYNQPLVVEPVCRSCNKKRGSARKAEPNIGGTTRAAVPVT